jgi:hypothetical protein
VNTLNLSVAIKSRHVVGFYSASALSLAPAQGVLSRSVAWTGNGVQGTVFGMTAPLRRVHPVDRPQRSQVWVWDWLGGLGYSSKWLMANVGYVGSAGVYTHLSSPGAHVFATATAADDMRRLTHVAGGFERVPLGGMSTSVYGRRIETSTDFRRFSDGLLSEVDGLWTVHLEQDLIGGVVDLRGGMQVDPQIELFDAILRIHERVNTKDLADDHRTTDMLSGVWAGVIEQQSVPRYGTRSRTRLSVGLRYFHRIDSGFGVSATVAWNDPAVRDAFGYADDNLLFKLSMGGGAVLEPRQ